MKRIGMLLLGLFCIVPAYAQDQGDSSSAPPADASSAAAPATSTEAPVDAAAAPAADAAAVPAATAPASDAAATPPAADAAAPATADTTTAPAADASTAPAADASAASTSTDATPASTDTSGASSTDTSSASGTDNSSSDSSVTPRTPLKLYVGYDYAHINFLISDPPPGSGAGATQTPQSPLHAAFGATNLGSNFNDFRAGIRVFDVIGIELHGGFKVSDGTAPSTVEVGNYEGLYVVPTGTIMNTLEVGAVVGYSRMKLERPGASVQLSGTSYGVRAELPLHNIWGALPNFRLCGGFMVYQSNNESRVYGTNLGLRYDFQI